MSGGVLPAFEGFERHFNAAQTQLVWRWLGADLETPVSAFLKLCSDQPWSVFLESVEGGTVLGRYSVIGLEPDLLWRCRKGEAETSTDLENWTPCPDAPLPALRALLAQCRIDAIEPDVPPMASSGLFGYFGYDMIRLIEDIPDTNPDELGIPDSIMMRPTVMVIFDNVRHMVCLACPVREHAGNSVRDARTVYDEARTVLEGIHAQLNAPVPENVLYAASSRVPVPLAVESNVSRAQFHDMAEKAIDYIRAGDIFQVVLSQRFSAPFDLGSIDLYRSLRRLNPSPFLFHLKLKDFALVGSSPEILVRVRDGKVTIRPIAGTRKRGETPGQDRELAAGLLADPKERAEHLMLLDLGRNDVGRVAETGSVRVTEQFIIEYYSHVMHIVSNVEGGLRAGMDSLDALFAGFPAGTVSGAPKIRAMEIIDELEPVRRSFYAGCVGYFDGNGNIDSCITLRTALVKGGILTMQAGAGVVYDSNPESEYQECLNKARAIIRAAELALEAAQPERQPAEA